MASFFSTAVSYIWPWGSSSEPAAQVVADTPHTTTTTVDVPDAPSTTTATSDVPDAAPSVNTPTNETVLDLPLDAATTTLHEDQAITPHIHITVAEADTPHDMEGTELIEAVADHAVANKQQTTATLFDPSTFSSTGVSVFCGPRGCGKTTLLKKLLEQQKALYARAAVVTCLASEWKNVDAVKIHSTSSYCSNHDMEGDLKLIQDIFDGLIACRDTACAAALAAQVNCSKRGLLIIDDDYALSRGRQSIHEIPKTLFAKAKENNIDVWVATHHCSSVPLSGEHVADRVFLFRAFVWRQSGIVYNENNPSSKHDVYCISSVTTESTGTGVEKQEL